jgi:hypothetical protein
LVLSDDKELVRIEGFQTIDAFRKELNKLSGYENT